MKTCHFMLDIETLGLKPGCQVLTVACAKFSPFSGKIFNSFYKRIDLDDYKNYNYFIDNNTLTWWNNQNEIVKNEAFTTKPRESLRKTFENFNNYIKENIEQNSRICLWSHGKEFDIPIVEKILEDLELPIFWKFWDTRDTRTLYDIANVNLKNFNLTSQWKKHHAMYDVELQIMGVFKSYEILGIKK